MKERIINILRRKSSSPFLFIGSGFSRRYTGLGNWAELLEKFTEDLRPFDYYYSSSNQNLPKTASLIAEDYHEAFWKNEGFENLRKKYHRKVLNRSSALKISISTYLESISIKGLQNQEYPEEIKLLSALNVDGIITTNWDTLLEELLPEYKVFIGQDELLFSNPQSIGEIYKIHGSATHPESLILTEEDYNSFSSRNAYLAAKLITIFVEHPIVFIGYGLGDPNIIEILQSIIKCLGKGKVEQLQDNLVFVQRAKGEEQSISKSLIVIDDVQLPISIIKIDTFIPIYEALNSIERKIPTRILRYCKEQFFELVKSEVPEKKLCLVDFDSIESDSDIEFVVGVGVVNQHLARIGYRSIGAVDLFKDLVFDTALYDPHEIIKNTLPELQGTLPVYKYLKQLKIQSQEDLDKSDFRGIKTKIFSDFQSAAYRKSYLKHCFNLPVAEIISKYPEKAFVFIPYSTIKEGDLEIINQFLKDKFEEVMCKGTSNKTYYRKLACFFDCLKFGW